MTEQLLAQQLESPSGTGRVEPRSQISLTAPALSERDTNKPTPPFSLAVMHYFVKSRDSSAPVLASRVTR